METIGPGLVEELSMYDSESCFVKFISGIIFLQGLKGKKSINTSKIRLSMINPKPHPCLQGLSFNSLKSRVR